MKPSYIMNLLISIDQLANAILLGDPDETISARCHYMRIAGSKHWATAERFVNILFFWDSKTTPRGRIIQHCELSFLMELRRRSDYLISHRSHTYKELIDDIRRGIVE